MPDPTPLDKLRKHKQSLVRKEARYIADLTADRDRLRELITDALQDRRISKTAVGEALGVTRQRVDRLLKD